MIWQIDGIAPQVDPDAWVAPDAQVIGRVRLGAGASVWFGAVLRGDNEWISVGACTNVQENSTLHTDLGFPLTIGAGCTIGHKAILHGCTIKDDVLIGMGATVMNGATVGAGSLIGAGALVPEGRVIPPGSLVMGMPGKVVRPLTGDEIAGLRASADSYAANARRFAAGLREV